jgi:hypothetical protein
MSVPVPTVAAVSVAIDMPSSRAVEQGSLPEVVTKKKKRKQRNGRKGEEKKKKSGKVAAPPAHVATPAADASTSVEAPSSDPVPKVAATPATSVEKGSSPIPALFIFSPSTISFLYLIYSYLTYRRHHPCRRCQP